MAVGNGKIHQYVSLQCSHHLLLIDADESNQSLLPGKSLACSQRHAFEHIPDIHCC